MMVIRYWWVTWTQNLTLTQSGKHISQVSVCITTTKFKFGESALKQVGRWKYYTEQYKISVFKKFINLEWNKKYGNKK